MKTCVRIHRTVYTSSYSYDIQAPILYYIRMTRCTSKPFLFFFLMCASSFSILYPQLNNYNDTDSQGRYKVLLGPWPLS